MSHFDSLPAENRTLAERINKEARENPASPYAGKFVGIANGQVVVVADNWREVSQRLREVEPDPARCWCIEASADYQAVHEIWSTAQRAALMALRVSSSSAVSITGTLGTPITSG